MGKTQDRELVCIRWFVDLMASHIELHPAFVWDCDDCGRENFVRSIVGEFDDSFVNGPFECHAASMQADSTRIHEER